MRQKTHFRIKRGSNGKGGGGFPSRVHQQQFCVSRVTKQIVYLISAKCLGDLCTVINSLGKPVVGGSERNLKLHQKTQK